MTTIRDEAWEFLRRHDTQADPTTSLLRHFGIDPDLPAAWATVDRCLAWLRTVKPSTRVLLYTPMTDAVTPEVVTQRDSKDGDRTRYDQSRFNAPTLHAALVAACKAIQESAP